MIYIGKGISLAMQSGVMMWLSDCWIRSEKDYRQLSERLQVLEELVPYTNAVELQDSLQQLAKMNEHDR